METIQHDTVAGVTPKVETCPGTVPIRTGALPGHMGTLPRRAGTLPGHTGAVPGRTGTLLIHTGALPVRMGTPPGHMGTVPIHMGAIPVNMGTVPRHTGTLPGHPSGCSYRVETDNDRAHTAHISAVGIPVSRAVYPGGGAAYKNRKHNRREEISFQTAANSKKE